MVKTCLICKSESTPFRKLSFHKFPKDELIRNKWIESLKLSNRKVNFKNACICSDHFDGTSFFDSCPLRTRSRLLPDAVPRPQLINIAKSFIIVVSEGDFEESNTQQDTNFDEKININKDETIFINYSHLDQVDSDLKTKNENQEEISDDGNINNKQIIKHEIESIYIKEENVYENYLNYNESIMKNDDDKQIMENIKIKMENLHSEFIIKNENDSNNDEIYNENINTEEKLLSCVICNKKFTHYSSLNFHKRIHTGEKPFSCDFCDKKFNDKSNLIKHERIHTKEKPFSCDICGKTFTQQYTLIRHKRTHTGEKPFSCEICNKRFNQIETLTKHKRTHSGEKPFSCEVCEKTFRHKQSLMDHHRSHTGEKPFSCEVCNKIFTRKKTLNRHKRSHLLDTTTI